MLPELSAAAAMELGQVLGFTAPSPKEAADLAKRSSFSFTQAAAAAASYPSPFLDEQKMLRFSKAAAPSEPGRCRRTDGKKWRCSKEAMAEHKYCERHINRNRHRSRKPVENQSRKTAKETPAAGALSSPVSQGSHLQGNGEQGQGKQP